jgi:hypothetical protein
MTSPEDIAQMASLMLALTQPDTETIRQAELALKPILKDARSIPALLEVIKARGIHVSAVIVISITITVDVDVGGCVFVVAYYGIEQATATVTGVACCVRCFVTALQAW